MINDRAQIVDSSVLGNISRDIPISAIRVISAVLIVLCHYFQYYQLELAWWLNVGVQIFFCISGFLYGGKEQGDGLEFIIKQFKKILVPYWTIAVIALVLYYSFGYGRLVTKEAGSILCVLFCSERMKGIGHLWFIEYILFCYFITPFLYSIRKRTTSQIGFHCCFLCVIFLIIGLHHFGKLPYKSAWIICYVFGYYLSAYIKMFMFVSRIRIMSIYLIAVSLLAIPMNCAQIYVKYLFGRPVHINERYIECFENYSHAFLGMMIFLLLYIIFTKHICKDNKILYVCDKYSFPVYLVHQIFLLGPFSLLNSTSSVSVNCAIAFMAIVVSAFILNKIVSFINSRL